MSTTTATQLLLDWRSGDGSARDRLVALLYEDLRRVAKVQLSRERRGGHTLEPTALVHEAYLRLMDHRRMNWQSRAHFLAIAAMTMRRILVSYARGRAAAKRGGEAVGITLREGLDAAAERDSALLALEDALAALARLDARQSRIVELRYFGGLTIEETAEVLQISQATVKLDWSLAKAWLFRELQER